MYQVALLALTAAGFLAMLTFVVLYARARWWGSAAGRHMMSLSAVLCTIFGLLLLARVVGRLPPVVWLVVMAALDAVLWGQVLLLLWARRRETDQSDGSV